MFYLKAFVSSFEFTPLADSVFSASLWSSEAMSVLWL